MTAVTETLRRRRGLLHGGTHGRRPDCTASNHEGRAVRGFGRTRYTVDRLWWRWRQHSDAAPAITTQPQSQTLTTGSSATFNVVASGTGTLAYQWNKNGAAIAGATSASYVTPAATLADSGASFTVVVRNSGGQVSSAAAVLTANANPEGIYTGSLTYNLAGTTWPVFSVTATADYSRAASGATIAGTYHYGYFANNFLVDATTTIDANGTGTASDTAMCQGPTTSTVPDPTHNAYAATNNAACPGAAANAPAFVGLQAFFPAGTGAALNSGVSFSTDTLVAVADNGTYGFMLIGGK